MGLEVSSQNFYLKGLKTLSLDCKYPTKPVSQCQAEKLVEKKIEYTKVYCSKCIDGQVVYRKLNKGFYCTNPSCEFYIRKIFIKEE